MDPGEREGGRSAKISMEVFGIRRGREGLK